MSKSKKKNDADHHKITNLKSREDFVKFLSKSDERNFKKIYFQILSEIDKAISNDDVERLKILDDFVKYLNTKQDIDTIRTYCSDEDYLFRNTNLVVLACRRNKVNVLKYLLSNNSRILDHLSVNKEENEFQLTDEDSNAHNGLYYAIRCANVELLQVFVDNYSKKSDLVEIISKAYEELTLKNVPMAEEMENFLESFLLDSRFLDDSSSTSNTNLQISISNIKERIDIVLDNIEFLNTEYADSKEIDEKFIFVAKFLLQNIHILKKQLKSTYIHLPWEEVEFCLLSFISSMTIHKEINLFFRSILTTPKILCYLQNFAKVLKQEKDNTLNNGVGHLGDLPKKKRDDIVIDIITRYPEFDELYNDHQQIRDIHSLQRISDTIELAAQLDPKKKLGHLGIIRCVQIIGEHLKNTLESPKLSSTTSDLMLLLLNKNTREIVIDLRNSLSHSCSLDKRIEVEQTTDSNFFSGLQNDLKKILDVVSDIVFSNKMKMIRMLLTRIVSVESDLKEIQDIAKVLKYAEIEKIDPENFKVTEHEKLKALVLELSNIVYDRTDYEESLFKKIMEVLTFDKNKTETNEINFVIGFATLKTLNFVNSSQKIDHNAIRCIKHVAKKTLDNIKMKLEPMNFKEIAELVMKLLNSVLLKTDVEKLDDIRRLTCEIFTIAEFELANVRWISDLREKLSRTGLFFIEHKLRNFCPDEAKFNKQLVSKLSELETILSKYDLTNKQSFPNYKKNKKLQLVVEMLVLDVMSMLSDMNKLDANLFFMDAMSPSLTGKPLRNHLAHDNVIINLIHSNPSIAILLNAAKLSSVLLDETEYGKTSKEDIGKLKQKYDSGYRAITNQREMFVALEEGNIKDLKTCIAKGADLLARNVDLWTAMHFAAKGPSLEVVKYVLQQNVSVHVKNMGGQTPFHIAAAHGRTNIVKFFITELKLDVNVVDERQRTVLHAAALNGHQETVKILLKHEATTSCKDTSGFSPLHFAVTNNYKGIAKILLAEEVNVDCNKTMGSFTSLHLAAENGHLDLVKHLIQKKADVNAKNDRQSTSLHMAALNGHDEVVSVLIVGGANVNSRVSDGCSPLHYAVENGHLNIAKMLLEYGTNVNVADCIYYNTPLHYASKDGYEDIVKLLLQHGARVGSVTSSHFTPLYFAVKNGHVGIVNFLLKCGSDLNTENNANLVHLAAECGHANVLDILIKHGANVHEKGVNGFTALHVAALHGHADVVELLIHHKAQINAKGGDGFMPLHVASLNGHKDVVVLLIQNNAKVNARTDNDFTPLHAASVNGKLDVVSLLIRCKAEVNAKDAMRNTPLCVASLKGHRDVVELLIKHKAQVNVKDVTGSTPLHKAVEAGSKDVVDILIANGAQVNTKNITHSPLSSAVRNNCKDIVEALVARGADVNVEGGEPVFMAVLAGYKDIVDILLKKISNINIKYQMHATLLHLAARRDHKHIIQALIAKGSDVNAVTADNVTPLYFAAQEGNADSAEVLIKNGAHVNCQSAEGVTPLHIASTQGHFTVIEVLLKANSDITIKDHKNRTPLELAVAHGHLKAVRTFLQQKDIDLNVKGNGEWTVLHIASQAGNLEIIKYLIEQGADVHVKNNYGSKAIHIAAREGYKDIVEFLISSGNNSIYEVGAAFSTLLHYAASGGRTNVAKYLMDQGLDVNTVDINGSMPIHMASLRGHKNMVEFLLTHGGVYNDIDYMRRRPIQLASDKNVIKLLELTDNLFTAVKQNNPSDVEHWIKEGGFIDAKNTTGVMPLHHASWKGFSEVVDVLLANKANPNSIGKEGSLPLHYAAKFCHFSIVKTLLLNGAMFNAITEHGKTPSELSKEQEIVDLLNLVDECFRRVQNGDINVVADLKNMEDEQIVQAVMNARNKDNKSLIVVAMLNDFPKTRALKQMLQEEMIPQIETASFLLSQERHDEALILFRNIYKRRKEVLGMDNPGSLDLQKTIADILYKQQNYQEALPTFEEVYKMQEEALGSNNQDALNTRSIMALVLHRLGKYETALDIFNVVLEKQKKVLDPDHMDILNTQIHMALVLDKLGMYKEALAINYEVFAKHKKILGELHPATLTNQNNIAMVLNNQNKHEEALKTYQKVYDARRRVLGPGHPDTLRTLHNMVAVMSRQEKYEEAIKCLVEVYDCQKAMLGAGHIDTLNTKHNIANLLLSQGNFISALRCYKESLTKRQSILGQDHPSVLDALKKIEMIHMRLKLEGEDGEQVLEFLEKCVCIAASNGDAQAVKDLIDNGHDANGQDSEGLTPLHYAASGGHKNVVDLLLDNGADCTIVSNKGNTPLHTACALDCKEIVEILLRRANANKLRELVNVQTYAAGTTALHLAVKNGSIENVKYLLRYGAMYDVKNKDGKTPIDLSRNENVTCFLETVQMLFDDSKNGNYDMLAKLRNLEPDEFTAVTNARNSQDKSVVQVAMLNKHQQIATGLLKLLKGHSNGRISSAK